MGSDSPFIRDLNFTFKTTSPCVLPLQTFQLKRLCGPLMTTRRFSSQQQQTLTGNFADLVYLVRKTVRVSSRHVVLVCCGENNDNFAIVQEDCKLSRIRSLKRLTENKEKYSFDKTQLPLSPPVLLTRNKNVWCLYSNLQSSETPVIFFFCV